MQGFIAPREIIKKFNSKSNKIICPRMTQILTDSLSNRNYQELSRNFIRNFCYADDTKEIEQRRRWCFSPSIYDRKGRHRQMHLTFGLPLSRLGIAQASLALLSLLHHLPCQPIGRKIPLAESPSSVRFRSNHPNESVQICVICGQI